MAENKRSRIVTSAALEMGRLVRLAASPMIPGEQVPHAIARAARRLGISKSRVHGFWYGKVRNPTPEEYETARQAAVKHAHDMELLRDEHRRAIDILARIEARLATLDPASAGSGAASLRDMAGSQARPRDGG
jgi:hypothetical protein